jgi:CheY-like chemotaxis protein
MANVLVIDDDEINNFTIEAMLERTDFVNAYEIQDSGWGALSYLKTADEQKQFPNLIFVDINMPEMDGYEFLERYEHSFWSQHKDTRVYMLSSSISESDKEKALSYTCISEYITKPLSRDKLTALMKST